jgi:hypothetical protein
MVPVPPVLVAMLRAHFIAYGTAPDGGCSAEPAAGRSAKARVRSNPARVNTSQACRSASTWVGRPGAVVVAGQAGGGLAGGVGGLIPELLAGPGEATAHPDEADPGAAAHRPW